MGVNESSVVIIVKPGGDYRIVVIPRDNVGNTVPSPPEDEDGVEIIVTVPEAICEYAHYHWIILTEMALMILLMFPWSAVNV